MFYSEVYPFFNESFKLLICSNLLSQVINVWRPDVFGFTFHLMGITNLLEVGGSLSTDTKTLSVFDYTDTYSYPNCQVGSTEIKVLDMPLTSSSDSPKLLTFSAASADLKKYINIAEAHDQGCYFSVLNYNSQFPMMIELIFTGQ